MPEAGVLVAHALMLKELDVFEMSARTGFVEGEVLLRQALCGAHSVTFLLRFSVQMAIMRVKQAASPGMGSVATDDARPTPRATAYRATDRTPPRDPRFV